MTEEIVGDLMRLGNILAEEEANKETDVAEESLKVTIESFYLFSSRYSIKTLKDFFIFDPDRNRLFRNRHQSCLPLSRN